MPLAMLKDQLIVLALCLESGNHLCSKAADSSAEPLDATFADVPQMSARWWAFASNYFTSSHTSREPRGYLCPPGPKNNETQLAPL